MVAKTAQRKLRIDRNKIYVSWQGVAGDIDGISYAFSRGTRLRGDHPLVQHMGAAGFVPDGVPASEMPTVFDGVVQAAEERAAEEARHAVATPPRIDPETPIGELVRCVAEIVSSSAGSCREGTILKASEPIAREVPSAFRPLIEVIDG